MIMKYRPNLNFYVRVRFCLRLFLRLRVCTRRMRACLYEAFFTEAHTQRGWSLRKKGKKPKEFSFLFGTQSKAWAGWPTRLRLVAVCCSVLQCVAVSCSVLQCVARLRLVRATPPADFAVLTVQL